MQMFLIAINGDFVIQARNITTAFTYNKKRPKTTESFTLLTEFVQI